MKKTHEQIIRNEYGEEMCKLYFINGNIVIQAKGTKKMYINKTGNQCHITKLKNKKINVT